MPRRHPQTVILSGLSGSGKSSALHILEDLGFFAIDNLPGRLLAPLMAIARERTPLSPMRRLALVMDAREMTLIRDFETNVRLLRKKGATTTILFFDARDDVLIRRFSETRRRHPLSPHGSIPTAIRRERRLLHPIRALADRVIDTSTLSVHDLRKRLLPLLSGRVSPDRLPVNLISFGYRFGLPLEADCVFDVRFLPNPHYSPTLRRFSGLNAKVRNFVLKRNETHEFRSLLSRMLKRLLKQYEREGKSYLTIALGCTGGRHRSVVLTQALAKDLKKMGYAASITHRDLEKGESA